jgi:hypothetical protein
MLNYFFSFTSFPLLSSCLPFACFLFSFPSFFVKWTSLPLFAHLPTSLLFPHVHYLPIFLFSFPFSLCCTNSTFFYPPYFPLPSFFPMHTIYPFPLFFPFFFWLNQLHFHKRHFESRRGREKMKCNMHMYFFLSFVCSFPHKKIRIHWYLHLSMVLKWKWQYFIIIYNHKCPWQHVSVNVIFLKNAQQIV